MPPTSAVKFDYGSAGCVTSPVALGSRWVTIIDALGTGIETQDAAIIVDPSAQIAASKLIMKRESRGNILRVRLVYDGTNSVGTPPIVKLFGRTGADVWQIIQNLEATPQNTVTLTAVAAQDVKVSGARYTNPDRLKHAWNVEGYDELVLGVETAMVYTGGGGIEPYVQGRMYTV